MTVRLIFFFIFFIISSASFSRDKADSSRTKLRVNAAFSINSNGIASIPAFSLGKPALVASINLAKGRFSYDPTLAYGLNLKPWYIDNWLHYKIIDKPVFELRTGFNISTFFSEYEVDEETILRAQKYLAFEIAGIYKVSPESSLMLDYWRDSGQDPGTLKGHFIDLVGDKSGIVVGKKLLLAVNLQLFYINYDGNNDGLFFSPRISSSIRNVPVSLFFQATQALFSNIVPFPGFRYNVGLSYAL